jgi:flagellar basal-body rod protein FlgF
MNVSLYQAAAALNAQARWQELITQNLAAGAVPGFRKQEVSFSAVQAGLDPTAANTGSSRYVIPSANTVTNFQAGEMRSTGNLMDFAVEGPGFFEVQLPNGTHAYTRDGEFHLNGQGQLVTKRGNLVLGENGPLQFDPNSPMSITVSTTGEVSQGDQLKGRLRLVEFNQPRSLTPIGEGYFLADKPGVLPGLASVSTVRQGFLETSNTSPTAEMASLIASMRMFEANQKVIQMQDERMGRVIGDLGNPS